MTTAAALRAHRLVSARMRVIRYEGSSSWTVVGVDGTLGLTFDRLVDALIWAQEGVK